MKQMCRNNQGHGLDKMKMVSALVLDKPVTDFGPQLNFLPWVIYNSLSSPGFTFYVSKSEISVTV